MTNYIIIGHPQSGYEQVEKFIEDYVLKTALSVGKNSLSPNEISKTVCKAHGAPLISELKVGNDIQQLNPDSVWHGMALDVMLNNINQPLWGWSDPQAIFLLNYWKELIPETKFILVYDTPLSSLQQAFEIESSRLTKGILSKAIRNWNTYNEALLHFFYRNIENCLLVHSKQVQSFSSHFIDQLHQKFDIPVADNSTVFSCDKIAGINVNKKPSDGIFSADQPVFVDNSLYSYLTESFIEEHPKVRERYEELQSVANMALDGNANSEHSPANALLSMISEKKHQIKLEKSVSMHQQCIEKHQNDNKVLLSTQLDNLQIIDLLRVQLKEARSKSQDISREQQFQIQTQQEQIEKLNTTLNKNEESAAKIVEQHNGLKSKSRSEITEIKKENTLLLTQLHTVQEELESYYLKNPTEFGYYYGAGDRVKQHLTYRLGATMIANSRSIFGWFFMPLALLRESKNFHKEKPQRKALKLPPIKQYQDAEDAKHIEKHLSYRLGRTFISNAHSPLGWVKLPFALRKEVKDFRHNNQTD